MEVYHCPNCNREVPLINQTIHSLRCTPNPTVSIETPPRSGLLSKNYDDRRNSAMIDLTENSSLASPINIMDVDNSDDVFPANSGDWACPTCTYINPCGASKCEMCWTDVINSDSSSNDFRDAHIVDNQLVEDVASGDPFSNTQLCSPTQNSDVSQWSCSSCTFVNQHIEDQCSMCGATRPPQESYRDRLLDDQNNDIIDPDMDTSDYSQFRGDSMLFSSSPNTSRLATSMMLGAGLGAGLAFLNESSLTEGALAGAGIGALTESLLRDFSRYGDNSSLPPSEIFPVAWPQSRRIQLGDRNSDERIYGSSRSTIPGSRLTAMDHLIQHLMNDRQILLSEPHFQRLPVTVRSRNMYMDVDNMSFEQLLERFQSPPRGVDDSTLSELPTHQYSDADKRVSSSTEGSAAAVENCSICLEEYKNGDNMRTLPCLHRFHTQCVDHWLRQNSNCPVCKHSVSS